MRRKTLALILLFTLMLLSCAQAVAATPIAVQQTAQSESASVPLPATTEPLPNSVVGSGMHFSGQGPTTWPIQKDPGMALLHVKVRNCSSLVISGKGQNIPYLPTTSWGPPGQFEDQYQYYSDFQGPLAREQTTVLDPPALYEDFDSPPHTEMLRIEEVSADCIWEVSILPISAARSIRPGQLVTGEYGDVLAVTGNLRGLELLLTTPGQQGMFHDFRGLVAVTHDGVSFVEESLDDPTLYENIPAGTMLLEIHSNGYWELHGK